MQQRIVYNFASDLRRMSHSHNAAHDSNAFYPRFKKIPRVLSQSSFVQLLIDIGFEASFDTAFLPVRGQNSRPKGYAFVRFLDVNYAEKAIEVFDGMVIQTGQKYQPAPLTVQMSKRSLKAKNLVVAVQKA